jgi:hypothetical protein
MRRHARDDDDDLLSCLYSGSKHAVKTGVIDAMLNSFAATAAMDAVLGESLVLPNLFAACVCTQTGAATGARKVVLLSHKLLCLILGAVSCVAVWRAPAFVATALAADADEWPSMCAENFRNLAVDLVALPLGAVALAAPWRTAAVVAELRECVATNEHPFYCASARAACVLAAAFTVLDVAIAPFACLAIAPPWRSAAVLAHVDACQRALEPGASYVFPVTVCLPPRRHLICLAFVFL